MTAAVAKSVPRGVVCRNCGKPIHLSATVVERKNSNPELITKIFPARCKTCNRESLYNLDEIVEF
jgi:hypothetical protein